MIKDIIVPLLLGLLIFLFGMKIMESALHQWAGPYLKRLLERFTRTPFIGMLTGTGLTAALQSSSAITVITIGLVNAGMLTFRQTLGIILGTNIGTCLTTELIGLNIDHLALPMLCISVPLWAATWLIPKSALKDEQKRKWVIGLRCLSLSCAGFACVLSGMVVMQKIIPALQSRGLFLWFLQQSQKSLVWGVIAGACLSAVIQSSAATIAITMGLASVQAISPDLGIAIALGANIGTCTTGLIASIGGTRAGRFVAWSHVVLNVSGTLLFLPLLDGLYRASMLLASTPSGQIAHAQTIFNIACSIVALPFCYLPFLRKAK